jgi:putative ABC transport system permease protein
MEAILHDLRYGCRSLIRNPGFAAVTVLTLAFGIGANTAIFSMIDAVFLRPLPYRDPERLMMVWEDASFAGFPRNTPAPANYADWKAQNQVFEDMAALSWRDFSLTGDGEPEKVPSQAVNANFFSLLGVEPALGRSFLTEEDAPGASRVAVMSHGLWQRRYGGDPTIVGREILLSEEKYTVVGVMPPRFQFMESYIGLWVPLALESEELANRGAHYLTVVARTKQGVSAEQANADIQAITARLAQQYQEASRLGAVVLPLREQLAGDVQRPLIVLLVAVGFVLLIACANVANLLLSRAVARRKEIAVRSALGASRVRMVRQLLTESLLLAGLAAGVGVLLAHFSFAFLEQLIPEGMSLSADPGLDGRVLGFTLAVALLTAIVFGLAPALVASKVDLNESLKQGLGRSGGATGTKLRSFLVMTQAGLAVILLVGSGLLIKTFVNLMGQYSMLGAEEVLTLRTALSRGRYDTHSKRVAFYDAVLERVSALPGVVSAGYTTTVPLEWKGGTSGFVTEGLLFEPGLSYDANHRQVSADYLRAMGIPIRRGRHLAASDTAESQPVAVVNETMARQYWPNDDPLGKRFKVGDPDSDRPWLTVVGVAADVRQMGADVPVKAEMYLPYTQTDYQHWYAPRDLVLRTTGDSTSLAAAVREQIRAVDPDQPVSNVRTMDQVLGEETANKRLGMVLLTVFAALALLLASIGIYGLLSYFVAQHTPEIGIRLALGARPRDVLYMVLRRGLTPVLLGTVAGLVAALGLARLISSLLFGVDSGDPATFAGVPLVLLAVGLLACYLPARRAARVDPNVALRYE